MLLPIYFLANRQKSAVRRQESLLARAVMVASAQGSRSCANLARLQDSHHLIALFCHVILALGVKMVSALPLLGIQQAERRKNGLVQMRAKPALKHGEGLMGWVVFGALRSSL